MRRALSSILVLWILTEGAGRTQRRLPDPAPIPAGTFIMGTDASEVPALLARYQTTHADLFVGETPRRTVRVNAFRLDRTEVTKARFAAFLRAQRQWAKDAVPVAAHNGKYLADWQGRQLPAGEDDRPVAFITWPAAAAYCGWAGGRLPTEAEWEYAARGGLENPEFPWGDAPPDVSRANWLGANIGHAVNVGRFAPNGYGLHDMAGNLWEFVADRWSARPETERSQTPGALDRHVIRGGSYEGAALNLRVRYRDSHPAGAAGPHVGFRCAY
jgi:formylglycine-generating enzyme required for sulfatase activity